MKFALVVLVSGMLLVGCNKASNQGGTPEDNNLHAGRGSGEQIDTNGNPAPARRPGPPDVNYSDKSGSGRIDQGGGATAGSKPESTPSTNVIHDLATNAAPR